MRRLLGLVLGLVFAAFFGCATVPSSCGCFSGDLGDQPATRKWARAVLRDILDKRYCTDLDERRSAFEFLRIDGLGDERFGVRLVASIAYNEASGFRRDLDIVSIQEALILLTTVGDEEALKLNERRIRSEPSLEAVVFGNLAQMLAWQYTQDVEEILSESQFSPRTFEQARSGLAYLSDSPETDSDVCEVAARIKRVFPGCVDSSAKAECLNLPESLERLKSRFSCVW